MRIVILSEAKNPMRIWILRPTAAGLRMTLKVIQPEFV
jgi:hypothetical protein